MSSRTSDSAVDAIKEAISTASCSSSTITLLTTILKRETATGTASRTSKAAPQPLRPKKTTGTTGSKGGALSSQETFAFAIEVVNLSLKTLGNAGSPTIEADENSKPTMAPVKSTSRARSGSQAAPLKQTYAEVAECCRLGLKHLRAEEVSRGLPPLQVDRAQSSFISKLVQLKMYAMALSESRVLKRRLEQFMASSKETSSWAPEEEVRPASSGTKSSRSTPAAPAATEVSMSELLRYTAFEPESSAAPLAVACQINCLRSIAGLQKPSMIEEISEFLQIPQYLLPYAHDKKTIRSYLPSLGSILLTLCPSTASTSDEAASKKGSSIAPATALRIQAVALECKALCITTVDEKTRLWQSLEKCMTAYLRRSKDGLEQVRYQECKTAFKRLVQAKPTIADSNSTVLDLLSSLAQEAGSHEDALRYITATPRNAQDECGEIIQRAKIASVCFKCLEYENADSLAKAGSAVERLIKEIDGVRKGRKDSLDKLFREVSTLRRSIASAYAHASNREHPCFRIFSSFPLCAIRFYSRYLAMTPENIASVRKCGLAAIDGIGSYIRKLDCNEWEEVDSSLRDCLELIRALNDAEKCVDSDEKTTSYSPYYERISDWYWKLGIVYRKESLSAQSIMAFTRSIAAQEKCCEEDILKSHYCARLEKIGSIWLEKGDLQRAEQSYGDAIRRAGTIGLVRQIGADACSNSLDTVFAKDNAAAIGRCLVAYMKIVAKRCSSGKDFLPAELYGPEADQGSMATLLEWQLRASGEPGDNFNGKAVQLIASILLEAYGQTMPVRRARTITKMLEISLNMPAIWKTEELVELAKSVPAHTQLGEDKGLKPFVSDIRAQCAMYTFMVSFSAEDAQFGYLETAISTWNSVFSEAKSWDAVCQTLDSPNLAQSRLVLLYGFLSMKGLDKRCLDVLRLSIRLEELKNAPLKNDLVQLRTSLAQLHLRLGNTKEAETELQKAADALADGEAYPEVRAKWLAAQSAYYIASREVEKAVESFEQARTIMGSDPKAALKTSYKSSLEKKLALNELVGNASLMGAKILFEQGHINDALSLTRKSIRFLQRNWAGLEAVKRTQESQQSSRAASPAGGRTSSQLRPVSYSTTYAAFQSPLLWKLVPQFHTALSYAAFLARHQGMVREAEYYMEQAISVVKATNSSQLLANSYTFLGDLKVRIGALSDGEQLLEDAKELLRGWEEVPATVLLHLAIANLHREKKAYSDELESYTLSEEIAQRIFEPPAPPKNVESELTDRLSKLQITSKARGTRKTPAKAPAKAPAKRTPKATTARAKAKEIADIALPSKTPTGSISGLQQMILTLKADAYAIQGHFSDMHVTFGAMEDLPAGKHEALSQKFVRAKGYFLEGISELASDPSLALIQDSILSLPHVIDGSLHSESAPKKCKKPAAAADKSNILAPFTKALDEASGLQTFALESGCTALCHKLSTFIGGLVVLISALGNTSSDGHADYASYSLEISKGISLMREREALISEKQAASADLTLEWPSVNNPSAPESVEVNQSQLMENFKREYIDIIPPTWAAVSLSLSENKEELFLCRYEAGREPFTVRLPLTRHNSNEGEDEEEEEQEEVFEYSDIVKEFEDIMTCAHTNTHQAKDITQGNSTNAIEQWWVERRALDDRLAALLENVERFWLGGFKGLIQQNFIDREFLAMFQASFERILNKYLPSRRMKTAGRRGAAAKSSKRATIDPRIYELFIGLGDPTTEDLESSLLDLINFIIDILQFHGETNAYDEIEMDEILVETTDALRAYYERIADHSANEKCETTHTILILDKALQMLPWECLPCLADQPISRLPSLSFLKTILSNPKMCHSGSAPGIYLDKSNGSYILNPALDLVSTQKNFEPDFKSLGGWSGIVGRPPSENEIKESLEERDVFLYLGHGSGAQYIRSRAVKKLDACAVSVLLGCSSGKLYGGGEYELYGVPWNYLLGGCPAILCCLWDVTDKDLDRFGKSVFKDWGLYDNEAGKNVSLVEAVAQARDSCKLKYLNGAAMVVYGIPAYL